MMSVNDILTDQITKLNCTIIPPGFQGDVRTIRLMQESLCKVIDDLGEQSALAQGLSKVITTSEKLHMAPTHYLYLLKDDAANNGAGEVIGMLKVGRKHLFLFDESDQVREVEPLCVLDFFVVCDRQRHGYGRLLYDHMLHDLETSAHEMPVDGPSSNMERFLAKNYGMLQLMRQNNNFAVSPRFFNNAIQSIRSDRCTPVTTPTVGRFAAHKPQSAIATVIHGGGGVLQEAGHGMGHSAPETGVGAGAGAGAGAEGLGGGSRPASLSVDPTAPLAAPSPSPSPGARRDPQLTDRGFFDVKFYHNKLW